MSLLPQPSEELGFQLRTSRLGRKTLEAEIIEQTRTSKLRSSFSVSLSI